MSQMHLLPDKTTCIYYHRIWTQPIVASDSAESGEEETV